MKKVLPADYAQMLLNGVNNFTATYFAEISNLASHDSIGRAIDGIKLTPKIVREKALNLIIPSANGYLALDDTVLDKAGSEKFELASAQYSGQKHGITTGIGVITLVYINPELGKYWIADYRIYNKDTDGKKKTDHALEMIEHWHHMSTGSNPKYPPFTTVLIDAGYTCKRIMQGIIRINKYFYGVMPKSRKVGYTNTINPESNSKIWYQPISSVNWQDEQISEFGTLVYVDFLPKNIQLKLFLVTAKHRTEYLVTNQIDIENQKEAKYVGSFRWKIEQFHREAKQLTGLAKCQARKARKQRNHIAIAFIVWLQLNEIAKQLKTNVYEVKNKPLKEYQKQLWRNPAYRLDPSFVASFA